MKIVLNISLVLAILLSSSAFAAKSKKQKNPPADKKTEIPANIVVAEPNKEVDRQTAPAPVEPNASVTDANSTVVTVNGVQIAEGQVASRLKKEQNFGRMPMNIPDQYKQEVRKDIIEKLVIDELLIQDAKKNNIDVNKAELDAAIGKHIAAQNLSIDDFKVLLKANGLTFGEFQQNAKQDLTDMKLMEMQFAKVTIPTPADEQTRAFYDENIQRFQKPEAVHVKHILIMLGKDANDPVKDQARAKEKAEEILTKLKAGANFEELARKYSECTSAPNGGDLGVKTRGELVPEFEKAAYALKPGQTSDVVQTVYGYHIIKLEAHIDAETIKYEDIKEDIKNYLIGMEKLKIRNDYIQKIRTAADVKYANDADKLELVITGEKPVPPSRKIETPAATDENKPAPKPAE